MATRRRCRETVRLGTLMLLIVIAALAVALVMERNRSLSLGATVCRNI